MGNTRDTSTAANKRPHRVVIIGGGFGGLHAALAMREAPVEITLVDRRNFHLFQPLLYTVATGGLSPGDIVSPLRAVLKKQQNTNVIAAQVVDIDPAAKRIILLDGELSYDSLIVATGVTHHYFGRDEDWGQQAPGLKSVEDALEIRRRIFLAYESAERETDLVRQQAWTTFVIVGGGPTGVELSGALSELAQHTLKDDFRNFNPQDTRIFLVEGQDRLLHTFPEKLSHIAEQTLAERGVTIRTRTLLTDMDDESVIVRNLDTEEEEEIAARTVLWAAGVKASDFGAALADRTGAETDRIGRLMVKPDLSLPNYPDIFVIGDMAHFVQDDEPLPGVAQVAMQQGGHVAGVLEKRGEGEAVDPFVYKDKGNMAVIGRNVAVADIGRIQRGGFGAWLMWLFIHINSLVEFGNKLTVMTEWAWGYITRRRGNRLITGDRPYPVMEGEDVEETAET